MNIMTSRTQELVGRFLVYTLILNTLIGLSGGLSPARAQKRVIVINADQPNVWTLEQAHYLLAQMHRRNLDLKAKSLDDLDPNEIAGLRFDVMRMLVEFGATFNQADLASNRMFSRNQEFNTTRREELTLERDRLRKESVQLAAEIDDLETKKADAESEEDKTRLDAKIASKKNRLAKVDKEVENLNSELATLNSTGAQQKGTTGAANFDPEKLPKSVFDKAFEAAASKQIEAFNSAPKINASLKLENFLQMQYEIIAKQLTLLRDEVGPGERLLFLELPQTVNVAHHESNNKWAQSWWKIAGYTVRCPDIQSAQDANIPEFQIPRQCVEFLTPNLKEAQTRLRKAQQGIPASAQSRNQRPITTTQEQMSILRKTEIPVLYDAPPEKVRDGKTKDVEVAYSSKFVNLDRKIDAGNVADGLKDFLNDPKNVNKVDFVDRQVRTVDLIPRQSSLNVNDMKLRTRAGAFNFALTTLFGFGSQLNVQRQREQFSQFVQQELYSSAFGKGSREFGWTFTPMPGMDRLQSGVRTTYAVVVVPEEATSVVLESNGCYFPRSAYQPNDFADTKDNTRWGSDRTSRGCSNKSKAFVVPIPSATVDGSNDFWIDRISYQPVGKGQRIVVLISGKNFSNQIGVLINGIPLIHSIGLAQPLMRDDSVTGSLTANEFKDVEIPGRIERVDANKIVFSFKMPKDFEGTPTITLVAPGKAIDLNWLTNIGINRINPSTLSSNSTGACGNPPTPDCITVAEDMFFGDPVRPIRIDSVEVFRGPGRRVNVMVTGAGFVSDATQRLFINGVEATGAYVSKTLLHVENISAPTDDKIQVTLKAGDKTIKSTAIVNPTQLKIDKVTVISYDPATEKKAGLLVVKIEGGGFPPNLLSSPRKVRVDVTSRTEAFLTIPSPNETEVVTLTDPFTRISVRTVIARKSPE
jgi:hypothetical protein